MGKKHIYSPDEYLLLQQKDIIYFIKFFMLLKFLCLYFFVANKFPRVYYTQTVTASVVEIHYSLTMPIQSGKLLNNVDHISYVNVAKQNFSFINTGCCKIVVTDVGFIVDKRLQFIYSKRNGFYFDQTKQTQRRHSSFKTKV